MKQLCRAFFPFHVYQALFLFLVVQDFTLYWLTLSHLKCCLLASLTYVIHSWQGLVAATYALVGESAISATYSDNLHIFSIVVIFGFAYSTDNVRQKRTQAIMKFLSRHSSQKQFSVNVSCIFFCGVVICVGNLEDEYSHFLLKKSGASLPSLYLHM